MVSCLLIDNNAVERHRISRFMSSFGIDCFERDGAADVLKTYLDEKPELVVIEASSQEAAAEMLHFANRQHNRKQKPVVILYSDSANMAAVGRSILEGASDFLVKPFDSNLLKFKLQQAGILPH